MRVVVRGVAGAVLVDAAVAAGCGNSKSQTKSTTTLKRNDQGATTTTGDISKNVPRPGVKGVTDTEIRVATVISETNAIGGKYKEMADGIQAYFDMVNDSGGIYGRKLVIAKKRDDQGALNLQETKNSLAQDNAFANFGATYIAFAGADALDQAHQPAFVWNINNEFAGHNNIFANQTALCLGCPGATVPWLAKQVGAKRIGILAYSAPQSKDCGVGEEESFKEHPTAEVVYTDYTLSFGQQLAAQVSKMKAAKVDLVLTCTDLHETAILGKEMKLQGLDAIQQLPNGYDAEYIAANADVYEGAYAAVQATAIEHQPQNAEIKKFLAQIDKSGFKFHELTQVGWILADQLVTGLKLSGPEFTQQSVIDNLNKLSDYSANGMIRSIDWSTGHIDPVTHPEVRDPVECSNWVKVEKGKFVPVFDQPGKPWVCVDGRDKDLTKVTYKSYAPPEN